MRGPRVRLACDVCKSDTELRPSSWSKYLRNVKPPPKETVQVQKPSPTREITAERNGEIVHIYGATMPRAAYDEELNKAMNAPKNPYVSESESETENTSGVGYVSDKIQKKWSGRYKYAEPERV